MDQSNSASRQADSRTYHLGVHRDLGVQRDGSFDLKMWHRQSIRIGIFIVLFAASLAVAPWGCKGTSGELSDALITGSVAAGTSAGLKLSIKDAGKQTVIAGYLTTYAGALRTISGNPTDAELTAQLLKFVPPEIQQQYPEISSFAIPLIVSFYHWAQQTYGKDTAQLYKVLNDVATGIETGSAPFIK